MSETKHLIIPGLSAPESADRLDKAMGEFYSASADTANRLTQFLEQYRYIFDEMMPKLDQCEKTDLVADLKECTGVISKRAAAQEEMLYAIAGRPNPARKSVA